MTYSCTSSARGDAVQHLINPGSSSELSLWLLPTAKLPNSAGDTSVESSLDKIERASVAKIRFERDRRAMLASYTLRRGALAELLGAAPDAIHLARDDLGRTFVPSSDAPILWTSLSRRPRLVGFAATKIGPIGVDVEAIETNTESIELLEPFLDLESLLQVAKDGVGDASAFATAWTLTEAFAKAKGGGLPEVSKLRITRTGRDRFLLSDATTRFNALAMKPDSQHVVSIAWPVIG